MFDYFILIAGLTILLVGGDILVRGAVAVAEHFSIPPLVIGLTIVSLGTSAPELFISVQAALSGSGGLAIGNVVGSNIANILLVLGLPATILASSCREKGTGRNTLVMIAITVVFMGMMTKGILERYDGAILIGLLILFLWGQYKIITTSREETIHDYHEDVHDIPKSTWKSVLLIIGGMIMLPAGAALTVQSASSIASQWNVSNELIGLTVVAIGTSLPELAASLMAVLRSNASVAVGNVIGSNIFNIAAIMGITVLIKPVAVSPDITRFDMWVMFAAAVLIGLIIRFKGEIGKISGLAMISSYAIYIVFAFMNQV